MGYYEEEIIYGDQDVVTSRCVVNGRSATGSQHEHIIIVDIHIVDFSSL